MKTYTTFTKENPDNPDELLVEFPEEMMDELGWKEGDTINWSVEDGKVILSKVQ